MDKEIYDMNLLYDAFRVSMGDSSWKEEPQRFERDFLRELSVLHHELEDRTYKTSEGSEFILNERGKIRYIHGSKMRDRVVRHALCDKELEPALRPYLIHNNGASQKGKGISFSRKLFENDLHKYYMKYGTNEGYIGFVDFSKFYDNIRHDKIREQMYPKIDNRIHWIMDEALSHFEVDVSYMTDEEYADCLNKKFDSIEYHTSTPKEAMTGEKMMAKSVDIGDQVSQNIGVFFPTRIDNYVKIVRGCKFYGRYMDDSYIIAQTREEVQSIIDGIKEQAASLGIFVHERKTHIARLSDTYKYLQIKYSLTKTGAVIKRINPKNVTRERRKLKAYKRQLDKGAMKYADIEQAYKSWMGSFASLMSKQQVKNMKSIYFDLFGKDVRWKKKHSKSSSKMEQRSKEQSTETTTSPGNQSQNQTSQTKSLSECGSMELPRRT